MVRPADRWRQLAVVLSAVLGFAVASLGSGAVVGTPVTEVAGGVLDTDATLVAPAGGAFAIWGVIYTGLLALAVWQALPAHAADPRQRAAGWWIAATGLLNAGWIASVQAEWLWLSVLLIVALLAALVTVLLRLGVARQVGLVERVIVDGTLGVYLGWVCIATVANTAAALVWAGVDATGGAATTWALIVLLVAGGVGVLLAVGLHRIGPGLALAWGLAWVAVERATGEPQSAAVAAAAAVAAGVTLLTAFAAARYPAPDGVGAERS
jgi:hypothetical protein